MQRKSKLNAQILEEAAEWFVELEQDEVDRRTRQRFDAWLRCSPEHVRAFLELVPIWEQGTVQRASLDDNPEDLIARALSFGAQADIVSLRGVSLRSPVTSSKADEKTGRAKRRVWGAIAASFLLLIALGVWTYNHRNTYSTGVGEQHSLALSDGSVVELNARSRVRIRYNEHERDVDLLEGQALFRVLSDKARPFIVHTGRASIRAVGTQFDVYRKKAGTTITVVEGRVSVAPETGDVSDPHLETEGMPPDSGPSAPASSTARGVSSTHPVEVLIAAGEQTTVTSNAVDAPKSANVAAATAWTQRRLVFQKTPLTEVVDDFNRYNARPMRIEDPRIQTFLVSGTFSSTDPTSLLRFLRELSGMRVIETNRDIRIEPAP